MILRNITGPLLAALEDTPVVLLNGARQTGKSTLVRRLAETEYPARYTTLDEATTLAAAEHDPVGFIAGLDERVIIDEIQRAPSLFLAIKSSVDRLRRPGRFLLTGSVNILLLPRLAGTLAGRMEILTLWPFSQGELAGTRESFLDRAFAPTQRWNPSVPPGPELWSRVVRGGYPEAAGRERIDRRRAWFDAYVTTMLQRDVTDIADIEGLLDLPRLLTLLATRAGSLLNTADISRDIGVPYTTLRRYLRLLEATFLLVPLPAWSSNLGKRLVKAPRLMLGDSGLLAHLLGFVEQSAQKDRTVSGRLLENFVVTELYKQATWSPQRVRLFYFRTQTGLEVDIVLENAAGNLVGIEVKSAATVMEQDFRGLRALKELAPRAFVRGLLLYTGSEIVPFGKDLAAVPVPHLWAE